MVTEMLNAEEDLKSVMKKHDLEDLQAWEILSNTIRTLLKGERETSFER